MSRKIRGFSRVESDKAVGWLVRIKRGAIRRSRFISDRTHGGKRKAMLAAKKVYEAWVSEMPEPETAKDKVGARNSTGVVGVHFSHDIDDRYPNCQYQSYIASWLEDDGSRRNVRFSCSKYGEDAFALACISREKRLADRNAIKALLKRRQNPKSTTKSAGKVATAMPVSSATAKTTAKKPPSKKSPAKKK